MQVSYNSWHIQGNKSIQKQKPSTKAASLQVSLIHESTASAQTSHGRDFSAQTNLDEIPQRPTTVTEAEISKFLLRIIPKLQEALNSQCIPEKWATIWHNEDGEAVGDVNLIEKISEDSFPNLPIAALALNSLGKLLALAFGHVQHEDFCIHPAGVIVKNLRRQRLGKSVTEHVFDTQNCMSACAFNPKSVNLLAAATCAGELTVWDLDSEDKLLATSGLKPNRAHAEVITSIRWVLKPSARSEAYQILTSGLDGKIVLWKKPPAPSKDLQAARFLQFSPRDLPRIDIPQAKSIGVTALHYHKSIPDMFFASSENGLLAKLKLSGLKTDSASFADAYAILYQPIKSHVTSIKIHPIRPKFMLICNIAGEILLLSTSSNLVFLRIQLDADNQTPLCLDWSPKRISVFAVGCSNGRVLLFDLIRNLSAPVASFRNNSSDEAVRSVAFDAKNGEWLLVGDGEGSVGIWTLPKALHRVSTKDETDFDEYFDRMG